MNIKRVEFKEFKEHVQLWQSKGHSHVTQLEFDDEFNYMMIVVADYVNPEIGYFMTVSNDMDWELLEANPITE